MNLQTKKIILEKLDKNTGNIKPIKSEIDKINHIYKNNHDDIKLEIDKASEDGAYMRPYFIFLEQHKIWSNWADNKIKRIKKNQISF